MGFNYCRGSFSDNIIVLMYKVDRNSRKGR